MKYFIPLVFLFFACTEEVIKYVDKPVYLTSTLRVTDTVETVKEKIVYRDSLVYMEVTDTIFQTVYDTITNTEYDTIVEIRTVLKTDTVKIETIVFVTDTVYVERSAKLEYDPIFEEYVNELLRLTQHLEPLIVDITIIVDNDYGVKSESEIFQGGWLIRIKVDDNCYEDCVYRELMHCLYGKGYFDGIMIQNWQGCLELMDERGRGYAITDAINI